MLIVFLFNKINKMCIDNFVKLRVRRNIDFGLMFTSYFDELSK